MFDEIEVGSVPHTDRQAKQRIERGSDVATPVPTEDELVQIAL